MKTINTVLPIYNRIEKQWFERGKKGGVDTPTPIVCPRHRLPSLQWNVEDDDPGEITSIELVPIGGNNELATGLSNYPTYGAYETFTTSGSAITSAINSAGVAAAKTTPGFSILAGDIIKVSFTLTRTSGELPYFTVYSVGLAGPTVQAREGENVMYLYSIYTDTSASKIGRASCRETV